MAARQRWSAAPSGEASAAGNNESAMPRGKLKLPDKSAVTARVLQMVLAAHRSGPVNCTSFGLRTLLMPGQQGYRGDLITKNCRGSMFSNSSAHHSCSRFMQEGSKASTESLVVGDLYKLTSDS